MAKWGSRGGTGLRALRTRGTPPPGRRCVLEGPPLGPDGEDITWPDQVAPRGRKASSTRKITPQTSNQIVDPNSPPGGRAVGGRGAPNPRRPSQGRKAPPPGTPFRHPDSEQRRPTRAHAVGLVLGPHARANRTRDTQVAEPRLPAPEDERPGEGQRLTPDAPHNGGRPTPSGTAPHHPRGTQAPQGKQAKGTVLGPHNRTPAPTARGQRPPGAGGQPEEGSPMLHGQPGEHLMFTRTHGRRPAESAYDVPNLRPAAPTARTPATGNRRPTPCS